MPVSTTYSLPDLNDMLGGDVPRIRIFRPDKTCIVLGLSNSEEASVYSEIAAGDHVAVMKRPSGGETVVLSPETLVISVVFSERKMKNPREYFNAINNCIIKALQKLGVSDLSANGISDICIRDKKILGSAIYRKSGRVLYHAVLNVAMEAAVISKYLRHPVKEPAYRNNRSHDDFVTSLRAEGVRAGYSEITTAIDDELKRFTQSDAVSGFDDLQEARSVLI